MPAMIDLSVLLSVISVVVAAAVAVKNIKRSNASDNRQEAANLTTLIVKLENISDGVNEIKSDMRSMKSDIQDLRDRLIRVEQSDKSAHHRLDNLEKKRKEEQQK